MNETVRPRNIRYRGVTLVVTHTPGHSVRNQVQGHAVDHQVNLHSPPLPPLKQTHMFRLITYVLTIAYLGLSL